METQFVSVLSDEERRSWNRRLATMAALLMRRCIGIPAEPAFDVSNPRGADGETVKCPPYGQVMLQDLFAMGPRGEGPACQLLVVDEAGLIKAESKELYSLGEALELLQKLPLPLTPRASQWLRESLGEPALPATRVAGLSAAARGDTGMSRPC